MCNIIIIYIVVGHVQMKTRLEPGVKGNERRKKEEKKKKKKSMLNVPQFYQNPQAHRKPDNANEQQRADVVVAQIPKQEAQTTTNCQDRDHDRRGIAERAASRRSADVHDVVCVRVNVACFFKKTFMIMMMMITMIPIWQWMQWRSLPTRCRVLRSFPDFVVRFCRSPVVCRKSSMTEAS